MIRKLSKEDVCALYGVKQSEVDSAVASGELEVHSAGGAVAFTLAALHAWMDVSPRVMMESRRLDAARRLSGFDNPMTQGDICDVLGAQKHSLKNWLNAAGIKLSDILPEFRHGLYTIYDVTNLEKQLEEFLKYRFLQTCESLCIGIEEGAKIYAAMCAKGGDASPWQAVRSILRGFRS